MAQNEIAPNYWSLVIKLPIYYWQLKYLRKNIPIHLSLQIVFGIFQLGTSKLYPCSQSFWSHAFKFFFSNFFRDLPTHSRTKAVMIFENQFFKFLDYLKKANTKKKFAILFKLWSWYPLDQDFPGKWIPKVLNYQKLYFLYRNSDITVWINIYVYQTFVTKILLTSTKSQKVFFSWHFDKFSLLDFGIQKYVLKKTN